MFESKQKTHPFIYQLISYGGLSLLILLLTLVALMHVHLHSKSRIPKAPDSATPWLQPDQLNMRYNVPVASGTETIDFYQLEAMLWKIQVANGNEIRMNSDTESQLKQINGLFGEAPSQQDWSRLSLLIDKGFSTSIATHLFQLIRMYHGYNETYMRSRDELIKAKGHTRFTLLQTHRQRDKQQQSRFFSDKTAQKLFAKRNNTLDYFAQRQLINLDPQMTIEQKRDKLALVEQRYKSTLQ